MKYIVFFLSFLMLVSCENTTTESTSQDTNIHYYNKIKAKKLIIPEEIKNTIDETVVFALANIGTWDGDNIGNTLYMLYTNSKIKRISNNKLPELGALFSSNLENYYETDSLKYNTFIENLQILTDTLSAFEYKTPDNLEVLGGSMHYVFINAKDSGFWIRFEPESSDLLEKIEKEFDKLFK